MHALHCVGLSKGGRGQKGGLSAYAEKVGKSESALRQMRSGAEVAEKVVVDYEVLQDKTQHLTAIHALPVACWQDAVEAMVAKGWSAKDTLERVKASQASTDKRTAALFTGKTTQREVAGHGRSKLAPSKLTTAADLGLRRDEIYEARQIRNVEREYPGVIEHTLSVICQLPVVIHVKLTGAGHHGLGTQNIDRV